MFVFACFVNTGISNKIMGKVLKDKYDDHFTKVAHHVSFEYSEILPELDDNIKFPEQLYKTQSLYPDFEKIELTEKYGAKPA